jgi:hypothetical protein
MRFIRKGRGLLLFGVLVMCVVLWIACWSILSNAQGPGMGSEPSPATVWRPNKKDAAYVGPQACNKCHETEVSQHATAMGRAMEPAATSAVLEANQRLTFRSGVSYEITGAIRHLYVRDDKNTPD